jgi:hypothetical protein
MGEWENGRMGEWEIIRLKTKVKKIKDEDKTIIRHIDAYSSIAVCRPGILPGAY